MAVSDNLRRDPPQLRGTARPQQQQQRVLTPVVKSSPESAHAPWLRIALLTILLSCAMVFSAAHLGPVWSRMLSERVTARERAELESLENHRLSSKFEEWLARGVDGLHWTVAALASERPGVSYHAEQALLREADSWRIRPRSEAAERILHVARALTKIADQLPASRRPFIRQLVERFATWPIDDAVAARELTIACDAILARLPPPSAEELLLAEREAVETPRVARSLEAAVPALDSLLPVETDQDPRELLPPADLPPAESEEPQSPPTKKVPKRFFAPRAKELPPTAAAPDNAPPATPVEPPRKNIHDWIRELADLEVMRLLHHSDYGVRHTAERELDRRGYSSEHLPLARQLVHPDPRERRKLAEQLPRLTNVDPRPWLLQLAEDDDQDVRRTAAGILQAARPGRESR